MLTPTVSSNMRSDYDGDGVYADWWEPVPGQTGSPYPLRSFEPGIGRVEPWTDSGGANTAYYHADMLGTSRLVTNSSGASINAPVFTAFGEKVAGTLDGSSNRYGYVGAHAYQAHSSSETPFLHVGARYYDRTSGRFLQRDPIGIAAGTNVFAYVGSRPTWSVDPLGLFDRPDGSRPWPKRPGSRPTPRPSPPAPTPSPPNETSDEEDEGIPPGWDPYDTAAVAFW